MYMIFIIVLVVINAKIIVSLESDINDNEGGTPPFETQRAQCTVTAGDVQASAEATVSKSLEGVCGSDEMKKAFNDLEVRIFQELEIIKELLRTSCNKKEDSYTAKPIINMALDLKPIQVTAIKTGPKAGYHHLQSDAPRSNILKSGTIDKDEKHVIKTKSFTSERNQNAGKFSREAEVNKLNNTMLSGAGTKLFAYYWKLDRFTQKLKSNASTDYSPVFAILGRRLRLKAFFNHLSREFLYLQLDDASKIREDFQSVFLETGSIFKPVQTRFQFKYKISVLEQSSSSHVDLESQEFISIDSGFLIPHSALLSNAYLKNDTILIKLIVYL